MTQTYGTVFLAAYRFLTGSTTAFDGVNRTGSDTVLRLYRLSVFTSTQVSSTGALVNLAFNRTTETVETFPVSQRCHRIVPKTFDRSPFPAGIEFWTGRRVTTTGAALRALSVAVDDISLNSSKSNMPYLTMEVPFAAIFAVDPRRSVVQPLTFREGEGFAVTHPGTLNNTWTDFEALISTEAA